MSTRKKRIQNVIRSPKNVSFKDLDRILRDFGYKCRNPGGGSSHYTYSKPGENPITVPKKKPVKEIYVKRIISILNLEEYYNNES